MTWLDVFQSNFSITSFYCFGMLFVDVLYGLKPGPFYGIFVTWQSLSSSVEAKVLIEPVLVSSVVIAWSPNRSLNRVNPVDLDTVVLWLQITFISTCGHFPLG
jgi:hypothetical protein